MILYLIGNGFLLAIIIFFFLFRNYIKKHHLSFIFANILLWLIILFVIFPFGELANPDLEKNLKILMVILALVYSFFHFFLYRPPKPNAPSEELTQNNLLHAQEIEKSPKRQFFRIGWILFIMGAMLTGLGVLFLFEGYLKTQKTPFGLYFCAAVISTGLIFLILSNLSFKKDKEENEPVTNSTTTDTTKS